MELRIGSKLYHKMHTLLFAALRLQPEERVSLAKRARLSAAITSSTDEYSSAQGGKSTMGHKIKAPSIWMLFI
jgi:hypothetical protein